MKKVYLETPEAVIKALKEGKEVRDKNHYSFKIVDGFIVATYDSNFYIGYTIAGQDKPYILEEEPIKIEVGKFYKTKNGQKARCFFTSIDGSAMFSIDGYDTILNTNSNEKYLFDIIGPWED